MKKLTSILLAVIMAVSAFPICAFADYDDDDDGDMPDNPIVEVYDTNVVKKSFCADMGRFIIIKKGGCLTIADDELDADGCSIIIEKGGKLVVDTPDMSARYMSVICEGELEIAEGASLTLNYKSSLLVLEKGSLTVSGVLDTAERAEVYCFGKCTGDDGIPKAEIAGAVAFRRDYDYVEVYYPSVAGEKNWFWQMTDRLHEYYGALDAKKMLPKKISALREQSYTDDNMKFIFLSSGKEEWHVVFLLTDGRTLEMAVKGRGGKTVSMCGIRMNVKK